MADNVPITTGSGLNIGAENITVSGAATLIQRVKIVQGTYDVDSGDVSSVNPMPITGSTTIVPFPSSSSITVNVTTAGTTTLIPSTATNSIYITDLVVSNGLSAGNITFGQTNTTTAGNIVIQPLYFASNGGIVWPINNPIKLAASTPFVATMVSTTTLSIVATYYVAP